VATAVNDTRKAASDLPHSEYARRLEARRGEQARQEQRYWKLVRVRKVVLALVVLLAWLTDKEKAIARVSLLAVPIIVLEAVDRLRNRANRAYHRLARSAAFYERRLACVEDRWAGGGEPGTHYLHETHPCALDLDLFGSGGLFELLCTARTAAGEDTLAAWLLSPATVEEVRERQAAVAELRSRLDLREDFALLASDRPGAVDLAPLAEWAEQEPIPVGPRVRLVGFTLMAVLVAALAGSVFVGTGLLPMVVAWLVGGGFAWWWRDAGQLVLHPIRNCGPDLRFLVQVLARIERERFESAPLCRIQAALMVDGRPASQHIARLAGRVGFWPLASLLFWTPPLAFASEAWRRRLGPALTRWLDAVGEFEALSAVAAYAFDNPGDPFPEMTTDGPRFDAQALGHPLLPKARCVGNDVTLGGELRLLVVSGSNMSGKSTLLRSVGVNVVLALAGAPVRAARLRLSPLAVGATLCIGDSLQAGRSRFFTEITRVRQLVDLAKGPRPLLFLLDELLSGTNSHDRRVGAEAVLRRLVEAGAVGLVTTHDLALTDIAEHLGPRAANVHFEDHLENGTITFDYRVRPGVVRNSNALALMRAVGIEV
jgi:hypothetical protein